MIQICVFTLLLYLENKIVWLSKADFMFVINLFGLGVLYRVLELPKIKGRVMKYLMHTFHGIDSLEFETTQFTIENQSFELLSGINQHGEPLLLENDDSVIIEQRVLKL